MRRRAPAGAERVGTGSGVQRLRAYDGVLGSGRRHEAGSLQPAPCSRPDLLTISPLRPPCQSLRPTQHPPADAPFRILLVCEISE